MGIQGALEGAAGEGDQGGCAGTRGERRARKREQYLIPRRARASIHCRGCHLIQARAKALDNGRWRHLAKHLGALQVSSPRERHFHQRVS